MNSPKTVMILAAGLGQRMRPLTDDLPKPLVPLAGHTLIDHTLDLLRADHIDTVIVNLHYKADMLETHLEANAADLTIRLSDERAALLDSGGGINNAIHLFDDQRPIITVNGDLLWQAGAIQKAWDAFDPARMDALLVSAPVDRAIGYDGPGDLLFSGDPAIPAPADLRERRRDPPATAPYYYCGIQLLNPDLFLPFQKDSAFSVKQAWTLAQQHGRLFAMGLDMPTLHIGTPDGRDKAEEALLKRGT